MPISGILEGIVLVVFIDSISDALSNRHSVAAISISAIHSRFHRVALVYVGCYIDHQCVREVVKPENRNASDFSLQPFFINGLGRNQGVLGYAAFHNVANCHQRDEE